MNLTLRRGGEMNISFEVGDEKIHSIHITTMTVLNLGETETHGFLHFLCK